MSFRIRELKPFIPSGRDLARAKAFFQELGFELRCEVEGLAELALDGAAFLLQDFHNQEMQDNLMMLVSVEDLDAWWRHIQSSGVLQRYETSEQADLLDRLDGCLSAVESRDTGRRRRPR